MKLKAPQGMTGFSHGGLNFEVKDGVVEMPAGTKLDEQLLSHGLKLLYVEEEVAPEPTTKGKK